MSLRTGEEKRKAARVKFRISDNLEIRYKFLSHLENFQCATVFTGGVLNLESPVEDLDEKLEGAAITRHGGIVGAELVGP